MIILALTLLAQVTNPTPSPTLEQTQTMPAMTQQQQQTVQALSSMMNGRSTMIIDPKQRASDYLRAFDILKQEKAAPRIYFQIRGGMKIPNVIDIRVMPGDTLMIFRYNTPQGIKFQVVGIEDILGIEHL